MNIDENNNDELNETPVLKNMNRKIPFTVPEGYFDSFTSLISDRIAEANKKPQWITILQTIFQPKFAFAVVVLMVLAISGIFYFNSTKNNQNTAMALSYDDISNSVYMDDMDETVLMDELSKYNEDDQSNTEEIKNYLIDNQTDISLIINEL
jgi:hypothetical protein